MSSLSIDSHLSVLQLSNQMQGPKLSKKKTNPLVRSFFFIPNN